MQTKNTDKVSNGDLGFIRYVEDTPEGKRIGLDFGEDRSLEYSTHLIRGNRLESLLKISAFVNTVSFILFCIAFSQNPKYNVPYNLVYERMAVLKELIQLQSFPVRTTLSILLQDKTTKKNIIWATGSYKAFGEQYADDRQITVEALTGLNPIMLQPRILKAMELQQERTRSHAEVFTPSWICNKMNNYCDEEWFNRKDVFNDLRGKIWNTTKEKIEFSPNKTWQQYVDLKWMEITCGEAPYIVSRYDASTGEEIHIRDRIGILDRKMRIINENTDNEKEWLKWVIRAFQSVYGYEYQGDNLLIGRINLIMTFDDYLSDRWNREATVDELKKIANIIAWNLWQMDGLTGTVPLGEPMEEIHQYSLFEILDNSGDKWKDKKTPKCRIFDWRGSNQSIPYESLKAGR